jgi:hypothetical protein
MKGYIAVDSNQMLILPFGIFQSKQYNSREPGIESLMLLI